MDKRSFPAMLAHFLLAGIMISTAFACKKSETEPVKEEKPAAPEVSVLTGEITENSITLELTPVNADSAAVLCLASADNTGKPEAKTIFSRGTKVIFKGVKETLTVPDLLPENIYKVYIACMKDNVYSDVIEEEVATTAHKNRLSAVKSTKNSITYHIDGQDDVTYQHGYVPGWYYDYNLTLQKETLGEEFDMDVFLWNLLVDYGTISSGTQDYTWTAGDYDAKREAKAHIVGGHYYYALYSLFTSGEDGQEDKWYGTPEAVRIDCGKPGESSESIEISVEKLEADRIVARMVCDPDKINFIFYNIYKKDAYDAKIRQDGVSGMMDYLFEYGYSADNTYTDSWDADPGTSYVLAVLGVDMNGDLLFAEKQIDTPTLQKEVRMTLVPYERELEGYHSYNTFELTVIPLNFKKIQADGVLWTLKSAADVEMYKEWGVDPENLTYETFSYYSPMPLLEEQSAMLAEKGYFRSVLTSEAYNISPSTEYYYFIAVPTGDENNPYFIAYTKATTEAEYGGGDLESGYSAYLGEWTVTGQSSKDYKTAKTYTLRFETLTPNRSFKVYGWGDSDVTSQLPFEALYDPSTGKINIYGEQKLGTVQTANGEAEVFVNGMISSAGQLYYPSDYSGVVYTCSIYEDRLQFFPNAISSGGRLYEVQTLTYMEKQGGEYFYPEKDQYQIVNFRTTRKQQ